MRKVLSISIAVVLVSGLAAGCGKKSKMIQNKGSDTMINLAQALAEGDAGGDRRVALKHDAERSRSLAGSREGHRVGGERGRADRGEPRAAGACGVLAAPTRRRGWVAAGTSEDPAFAGMALRSHRRRRAIDVSE